MKKNNTYKKGTTYIGKVDHVSPQYAYIIVDSHETDIFVPAQQLNGAWHQDQVKVLVIGDAQAKKPTGKVVHILERTHTRVTGNILQKEHHQEVIPDHKRLYQPVVIMSKRPDALQAGEKVIVQIIDWATPSTLPKGVVTQSLGHAGTHETETKALIIQFGLDPTFPQEVEHIVAQFPETLTEEELNKRRDFRNIPTLTIDPADAKDFDDALSIHKLSDDRYQIGVHIADVSHYIHPKTLLDRIALERANSTYLVGQTIPMLPERLSNHLCSLKPNLDRPTFSALIDIDTQGKVHKLWIGEGIIHSDKRFTYQEAQQIIDTQQGPFATEITLLNKLAQTLRSKRIKQGSIAFTSTDVAIALDTQGNPINITAKETLPANQLIEEFMLLANKLVATHIYNKKQHKQAAPFLYRVHKQPDEEKLQDFARFAKLLGHTFKTDPKQLPHAFNQLLQAVKGTPQAHIIHAMAIRTMSQACYDTKAAPHFGLAFDHYTHFTSPIRRYPDLLVHRLLKQYLQGIWPQNSEEHQQIAQHTSSQERRSIEAERASINYKQVLYMKKMEKQTTQGIISGVTEWGIYIEVLKTKCEGMVRLAAMKDDYYFFDPKRFLVQGKRTKKTYKLGDLVDVQILHCDLERRTIDLAFVG